MKSKFKIGDRVKIVVPKKEVLLDWACNGKTATIVAFNDKDLWDRVSHYVAIWVDNYDGYIHKRENYKLHWNINPDWLQLIDPQMVFDFMKETCND